MNLTDTLPPEELVLARLTTDKLAKVMHGLMSVGTASLELDSPADFLAGREKTPLGFLEVLRCIGVRPGHAGAIELLRERVGELSDGVVRIHAGLVELAGWRSTPPPMVDAEVVRLADDYALFCDRLESFGSLLGMEGTYADQARRDRAGLEGFFRSVCVQR
jgi:hypothetical protein